MILSDWLDILINGASWLVELLYEWEQYVSLVKFLLFTKYIGPGFSKSIYHFPGQKHWCSTVYVQLLFAELKLQHNLVELT